MSGSRAKAIRRERFAAGIPANGRTVGTNVLDLEDNRADRRLKRFHKPRLAAELRDTDPIQYRIRTTFWDHVRIWLTQPAYRDALPDPTKGKK